MHVFALCCSIHHSPMIFPRVKHHQLISKVPEQLSSLQEIVELVQETQAHGRKSCKRHSVPAHCTCTKQTLYHKWCGVCSYMEKLKPLSFREFDLLDTKARFHFRNQALASKSGQSSTKGVALSIQEPPSTPLPPRSLVGPGGVSFMFYNLPASADMYCLGLAASLSCSSQFSPSCVDFPMVMIHCAWPCRWGHPGQA